MIVQQLLGFFCSVLIGFCLGLMGGGGSMLTLPVLVYLLGIDPVLSTAYSLFVVGASALVGSVHYIRKQQVHWPAALLFSVPSFGVIVLMRRYVVPSLPAFLVATPTVRVSREVALMIVFALLMLVASLLMITNRPMQTPAARSQSPYTYLRIVPTGAFVGSLTGLIGIGGGFLIVPSLVLLTRLPMKKAVGTSLLIIAANSIIGFLSGPVSGLVNWPFLLTFTTLAMIGILVGSYVSRFVSGQKLRRVFGWSVLAISLYIMAKETKALAQTQPPAAAGTLWHAPSLPTSARHPDAALIRYGQALIARTAYYLGPNGKVARLSNGMNCQNCHLDAGTKPWGNNYGAVAATYPRFRERSGTKETIVKRVSDCFERSLNGRAPDSASREMRAIVAYIQFIGQAVPKGESPKGVGLWPLAFLDRAADPARGRLVYDRSCVVCHGADGQGKRTLDGRGYTYPPLWGPHSYNTGAGLYRLSRLAGYVKANMPLGISWETPLLSDEEAWDLAAYINSQPRPTKVFSQDWPNLKGKPVDHPFGPFVDSFPEQQHKFGPFKPIEQARKAR